MTGALTNYQSLGSPSYRGRGASDYFPYPYLDYTSTEMWRSFADLLDWSEFMFLDQPEIEQIYSRLFNYFITDVLFSSQDPETKVLDSDNEKNWQELLGLHISWPVEASSMLRNVACYGNDFITVVAPIIRYLRCPTCGHTELLQTVAEKSGAQFRNAGDKFYGNCNSPYCRRQRSGETKEFEIIDLRDTRAEKYKIKHWPVREMVIHYYPWQVDEQIYWKIPEYYKKAVRQGDLTTLATADRGVLRAIAEDKLYKFREDRIFHAKEPTLSGILSKGWGLPRTIALTKQSWSLQMLRKNIQALNIDYVTPIRLVSPENAPIGSSGVSMGPTGSVNVRDLQRQFNSILAEHRRDPTQWHTMSVPMKYQIFGGEANQLFPVPLHQQVKEDLVDGAGVPIELYKANLSVQTAPVGLRLFESQNRTIPAIINKALRFVVGRITELSRRDPVKAIHERVTIADDLTVLMAQAQMAMAGQLSLQHPLRRMGIDLEDDLQRQNQEQIARMQMQQEMQERMAKQEQGKGQLQMGMQGGSPAGGDPAAAGGDPAAAGGAMAPMLPSQGYQPPQSIDQIEPAAMALAQQLDMMDNLTRSRELDILRQQHPVFHSSVMQMLERVRYERQRMGGQMLQQQGMM